ncbi:hypothetical protein PoHVEF18_003450 [Penicillium ochrochloron]
MSIPSLSAELLGLVVGNLEYASDVNSLAQTCRSLDAFFKVPLYRSFAQKVSPRGLEAIIRQGNTAALLKLMTAGFNGQLSVLKLLVAHYGDSLIASQFVENSEAGCQMLEAAVRLGHTDIVRFLLEKGVPRNMRLNSCAQSLLSLAAGWGHLDLVPCLVTDVQASIDSRDVQNRDPLWGAAYHGHLDVIQYLMEAGSDINIVCSDTHWTSLYAAAAKNCEELIKYLLGLERCKVPNMRTLAEVAAYGGGPTVALILGEIDMDASVAACRGWNHTYLLFCAIASKNERLVRALSPSGFQALFEVGRTSPLTLAIRHGHQEILQMILAEDTKATSLFGGLHKHHQSMIREAMGTTNKPVIEKIVAFPDAETIKLYDLEMLCGQAEAPQIGPVILERVWKLSSKEDHVSDDIIFWGLQYNTIPIVEGMIRDRGLGPFDMIKHPMNHITGDQSPHSFTLLESAAILGSPDSFKMILARCAFLTPEVAAYGRVLAYAVYRKQPEIGRLFLDANFNANSVPNVYGVSKSLLILAANTWLRIYPQPLGDSFESRQVATIRLLIESGANVNILDEGGRTALDCAITQENTPLVAELLRHGANPLAGETIPKSALYTAVKERNLNLVKKLLEGMSVRNTTCRDFELLLRAVMGSRDRSSASSSSDDPRDRDGIENEVPGTPSSPEDWADFFVLRTLKSHYWRLRHPVPDK